jgi:transposase-like protein
MDTRKIAVEYRMSHWAQIIQNRIKSGLSIKAFCENAEFHENIYYYWQRKLRETACEELAKVRGETTGLSSPVFAEVKLAARTVLPPSDPNNNNRGRTNTRVTSRHLEINIGHKSLHCMA